MGQLTNQYVSSSYQGLLKMTDSSNGLTNTLQTIQTGDGDNSPLQMSFTEVNISGSFFINNVPITNGTNGTSGTSGVNGSSGSSGTSGSSGSAGTSGSSGSNGSSGTSGSSGSSGTSGGTGSSGSSGTSGINGSNGSSGTSGVSGSSGSAGSDGSSGTSGTSGDSLFAQTGSFYATTNDIQITGSLTVTGGITGSITNAATASNAFDLIVYGKNNNAGTLTKGTIVRIVGANGDNPLFDTASWEDDANSANTLGMLTADVAPNAFANIVAQGTVIGINTDGMTAGQMLYLSASGQYTTASVPAPYHEVRLGQVLRPQLNNGSAYISVDNGYELTELHDVDIVNPVNGDLLVYRSGSYGQWVNETGAELGFVNTGSYSSTQAISGSLILGNTVLSGSLVGNTINNGLINFTSEARLSGSVQLNITSSFPVTQSNLLLNGGPASAANLTGSIVISGSNNIIMNPFRISTIANFGSYGYIGGNNLVATIPQLSTASLVSPTMLNNNLNGTLSLTFTTSSLVLPSIQNNQIIGGATINHPSGTVNLVGNIIGGALTSNANTTTLSANTIIQNNLFGGAPTTLNQASSSVTYFQNVGGGVTVQNNYTSSVSTPVNNINLQRNTFGGSGNVITVSGSNSANRRNFNDNTILGINNRVNSDYSTSTTGHLAATALLGQDLIVSASNTAINNGGTVIVGRFNATGSLQESSNETVFVVGNGVNGANRRNALRVDNNGNSNFTGSVNISGSLSVNGISPLLGTTGLITTGSYNGLQSISSSLLVGNTTNAGHGTLLQVQAFDSSNQALSVTGAANFNTTNVTITGTQPNNSSNTFVIVSGSMKMSDPSGSLRIATANNQPQLFFNADRNVGFFLGQSNMDQVNTTFGITDDSINNFTMGGNFNNFRTGSNNLMLGVQNISLRSGSNNLIFAKETQYNTGSNNLILGRGPQGVNECESYFNLQLPNSGDPIMFKSGSIAPLTISGSVNIEKVINLQAQNPLPTGNIGDLAVSGSSLYFYNGAWTLIV